MWNMKFKAWSVKLDSWIVTRNVGHNAWRCFFSPVQWNWSGTLGMQMSVGWLVGWSVCWLVGWLVRNARTFLPINHEWMIGFWWYLHIWLVLMRCWSWPKVKVTRSKVKVKSTILWKIYFDYKPWLDDRNMMMLGYMIGVSKKFRLT